MRGRLSLLVAMGGSAIAVLAGSTLAALAGSTVQAGAVTRHPSPLVRSARNSSLGPILVTASGLTLYHLTSESSGKVRCTGSCVSIWPPLVVRRGTRLVAGPGVRGHLGTVARPVGQVQVTFDGWPLYTYVPDVRPGQVAGEGINAFGGIWYAIRPTAAKPTAAKPSTAKPSAARRSPAKPSTAKPKGPRSTGTTSRSSSSGGYGY